MLYIAQVALIAVLSVGLSSPSFRPILELARAAGARVSISQSRAELRELCFADAERELQECQEVGRENCAGVYEQDRRVCLVRYPMPPPRVDPEDEPFQRFMKYAVIGFAIVMVIVVFAPEEDEVY